MHLVDHTAVAHRVMGHRTLADHTPHGLALGVHGARCADGLLVGRLRHAHAVGAVAGHALCVDLAWGHVHELGDAHVARGPGLAELGGDVTSV